MPSSPPARRDGSRCVTAGFAGEPGGRGGRPLAGVRSRALAAAFGAPRGRAAVAALARRRARPPPGRRCSSSCGRPRPATRRRSCADAGATTVSTALRLYRLDGAAAARVLPGIRACHALRFTTVDRPAGTLSMTDFSDPLVPTEWWRTAIGVADLTPPGPGQGRDDHRFRRRPGSSGVRGAAESARAERAGAAADRRRPRNGGRIADRSRRERRRHRRDLPRGPAADAGMPRSARARSSRRATSSPAFSRRRAPAPA